MSYVSEDDLTPLLPKQHLIDALDDDRDGAADDGALDKVIAAAELAVNGPLAARFAVPFTDPPLLVKQMTVVFALEILYTRRGASGDNNPHTKIADAMRKRLEDIAAGKAPLTPQAAGAGATGAAITEPSSINGSMR